jgi:hypothetical protein
VQWTNGVNVSISGNTLRKTGGCGGCADAGASSVQQITTNGGVFVTASDVTSLRFVGLTTGGATHQPGQIRFALRLQSGVAEVRESGSYRADVPIAAGDVLGVTVSGGVVQYSKNGGVFYTSAAAVQYPLVVDASIYDLNATISNAMLVTAVASGQQVSAATARSPSTSQRRSSPAVARRRIGLRVASDFR